MNKKDKLVQLNTTIPASLRKYAETVASSKYDSISDYIRTLIRNDMKRAEGNDFERLVEAVGLFLRNVKSEEENVISSKDGIDILQERLATISHLFDVGVELRTLKIKKKNPKIKEKELIKKLNAWITEGPIGEEVPGLFEVSEERKKRFLNG